MQNKIIVTALMLVLPTITYAVTVADYLIDSDIGEYSRSYPGACPKGSGVLAGAGHFKIDHTDYACDIRYYNEAIDNGVEVQVTKHTRDDSDKWLLHEVSAEFRNYYGIPGLSYTVKNFDGNTIFVYSSGGRDYRWLSGSKVVVVDYTDLMMEKPEPIEVVKAYLAKHPSTLVPITLKELRSTENVTKWIKDEMDRRLWLCDKWFYQLQLQKVQQSQAFQEAVKSMNVFLDYREKYYGLKAADEKNLLAGYLIQNNGTAIKAKLKEYKDWWALNKDNATTLP